MSKILQIRDLGFSYGTRKAVDGVSLDIGEGQLFGLLGPNGAGKTTTISCICGLLSSWTGAIEFQGQALSHKFEPLDRAQLGVVPQELAIYEDLTAVENLNLFAKLTHVPSSLRRDRVQAMIQFAGLEGRERELVRNYSGGMKRRLNLVAGLIHQPKLLILDEPTVGVDPQSRNHLFDCLTKLKAEGMAMLYTTHYMEEAQRLCDHVGIMNDGKLIASGTSTELSAAIGDPTADLEKVFLHLTGRTLRDE